MRLQNSPNFIGNLRGRKKSPPAHEKISSPHKNVPTLNKKLIAQTSKALLELHNAPKFVRALFFAGGLRTTKAVGIFVIDLVCGVERSKAAAHRRTGRAGTRYVHALRFIRAAALKRQAQLRALAGQRFGC